MSKVDLRNGSSLKNDVWEESISQNNEDVVIKKILQKINISDKIGVDVGSWDGLHYSNIYNLLKHESWGGILIESNSKRIDESRQRWKDRKDIKHYEGIVNREDNDINIILKNFKCPKNFGIFNLDIDSIDFWVWKDLTYTPEIVCIEHNGNIIDDDKVVPYSTSWEYSHYQDDYGASAKSLLRLGHHKGYKLVSATHCNLIFVKNKVANKFETINEIDVNWFRSEVGVHNNPLRKKMPRSSFHFNPEVGG